MKRKNLSNHPPVPTPKEKADGVEIERDLGLNDPTPRKTIGPLPAQMGA